MESEVLNPNLLLFIDGVDLCNVYWASYANVPCLSVRLYVHLSACLSKIC